MSADRPAHPDDAARIRHLRRTMGLVATRSAATSDWAEVEARVLAGGTNVVASIDGRRRRVGWLTAAAVLVVAAAIAAAVVATGTDPDDGRVRTSQVPEGSSGGWYVPEDLPKGWTPFRITAYENVRTCLCRSAIWREVAGDGWVQFRTEGFEPGAEVEKIDPAKLTIDLGGGFRGGLTERSGVEAVQTGEWDLGWSDDDHYGGVSGSGISSDQATAIGRALVADPTRLDVPIKGAQYELVTNSVSQRDRVDASVQVEMRRPDGGTAMYSLRPPSTYVDESPEAVWNQVKLPGQALPVETLVERVYTGPSHGYRPWTNYRGEWEGSTMTAPGSANVKDGTFSPNAEQVATLVGSLRPVSLDEWRAFVRRAEDSDPRLLEIESVAGLITGRRATPTTAEVPTSPTTSSAGATSPTMPPNERLQGQFPDGADWTVERDPAHGLCAVLAETNVGCDDVGPVVPADADPSTVRWGVTGDRWLAYATLPEGATGVLLTPLAGAPTFSDPRIDLKNRLWGAGGDNPDQIFAIGERFQVRYRMADGTLLDAPTAG